MARYLDVLERLLADIAGGAIAPGATVPSVRELARREGVAPTTAARVHGELARQGVTAGGPRRRAVVKPDGPQRARRMLAGGRALRLAGSDDPLLDLLLAGRTDVDRVADRGSFAGLSALWAGTADAATLHLRHRDGTYNAPLSLSGRAQPRWLPPRWRAALRETMRAAASSESSPPTNLPRTRVHRADEQQPPKATHPNRRTGTRRRGASRGRP
jgi:DNA-binding transcriptional MocR family regulator